MAESSSGSFEPGFLSSGAGALFLLTYPARRASSRRAVLIVPAFAEEMNKCRRQVALAARAFAAAGITTFVPDLSGTGDSDGDFGAATLTQWRADLAAVTEHIAQQGFDDVVWLGVRAGALLAMDALNEGGAPPARLVLWQPVVSGKTMVSQFLRLKAAASLTQDTKGVGVSDLRKTLASGGAVEVAGYWLNPSLVAGFDGLHLKNLPAVCPMHWFQVQDSTDAPPPAQTVLDKLTSAGAEPVFEAVTGEPFWSTAEISLAPALIDATCASLTAL